MSLTTSRGKATVRQLCNAFGISRQAWSRSGDSPSGTHCATQGDLPQSGKLPAGTTIEMQVMRTPAGT